MANSNGWGDGSVNNSIGWGQGANNTIGWGKSQLDSWSGATDIDGGNLPSNSVAPAITGTAQEGQTLTCSTGTWSGSPSYTYQWKRNGNNIGGATNSTYTLVTADVGQNILCTVTATNFVGSANADSNTVIPISAFSYLLDTYSGASTAYSFRKLSSTYTGNCIRVRRSSDNTEQNIGFVNNVLDEASLLSFVGYNLFTYSEDISQSQYTKQQLNTTGTPAYLNVETAPDGTLTADKLIENTVNSQHTIYQSAVLTGFTPGIDHNVSVYLKAAERTAVKIFCDIDGVGKSCIVDLTNGSVSSSNFVISPVVTSVGNGWYRFSVTQSSNTFVANFAPRIFLLNSSNQDSYLGDGTSGVYVWGFQLTRTSSVQTYSKTAATANAGNGFVTTWYDQSGNANNATNSTAIAQPQIVSSGAMILINGKPSVQFDGSNDQLNLATPFTADVSNYSSFVGKRAASGRSLFALAGADAVRYWLALHNDNLYYLLAKPSGTYLQSSAIDTTTNQLLITGQNNAGTMSIFKNGGTITTNNPGLAYAPIVNAIGKYAGNWTHSNIQETIFYNTDQSANRTGIESNINTFYTIY